MKHFILVSLLTLSTVLGNAQVTFTAERTQLWANNPEPGNRVFVFGFKASGSGTLTVPLTFSEDPGFEGRPHLLHLDSDGVPTEVTRFPTFGSNRNVWGGSESSEQVYSFTFDPSRFNGGSFLVTAITPSRELTITSNLDEWTVSRSQTWGSPVIDVDPANTVTSITRVGGGTGNFFRNDEPVAQRTPKHARLQAFDVTSIPQGRTQFNALILASGTYIVNDIVYTHATFVPDAQIPGIPNNLAGAISIYTDNEETFQLIVSTHEDFPVDSTWTVTRSKDRLTPSGVFREEIPAVGATIFLKMVLAE